MNLERWLEICTKDIATPGALRIQNDIREHYHEALAAQLAQGVAQPEAQSNALQSLGDAHATNAQCKRVHFTVREQLALEGASKRGWWGSSLLLLPLGLWSLSLGFAVKETLDFYPEQSIAKIIWINLKVTNNETSLFLMFAGLVLTVVLFALIPKIKTKLVEHFSPSFTIAIEGLCVALWLLLIHEKTLNTGSPLSDSSEMIAALLVLVFFALRWFWVHVPLLVKLHQRGTPQLEGKT